ncbi:MAG: hypothetical protein J0H44_13565 [Alphaproteobacteria bacterium]|nr:hypothetical protein [Alphaproteobacteria bacterium]
MSGLFGLAVIAAIAGAIASYSGLFGPTGADYFRACWEKKAAQIKAGFGGDARPSTPEQAIAWARCAPESARAIFSEGIILAGQENDNIGNSLRQACPSGFSDIPMGGAYMLTVKLVEDAGGPTFLDRILPAHFMIARVWSDRWPNCSKVREQTGYPKIVETSPGNFDWAWKCPRCK